MSECKCDFRTFMVGDGCEVCNPAQALEYAKETIAELEAGCDRMLSELLPGPFYMDPPDGGDVPVMEQLRRMAEDAARFRWLTEDHADRETRVRCRAILKRMPVISYSAACLLIDAARAGRAAP